MIVECNLHRRVEMNRPQRDNGEIQLQRGLSGASHENAAIADIGKGRLRGFACAPDEDFAIADIAEGTQPDPGDPPAATGTAAAAAASRSRRRWWGRRRAYRGQYT